MTFALVVGALTWAVFAVLGITGSRETADMASLNDIVDTSAVLLAVVVGGLALMQWTLHRERDDLFVGIGLLALGLADIGFDNLIVPRLPVDVRGDTLVDVVAPLGFVAAFALLAAPVVWRRLRARYVAGAAALAVVATVLSPTLSEILAGRRSHSAVRGIESAGQGVVVVVVLVLAWSYWRRARAEQRTFHAWIGLTLFVLAQSRAALAVTASSGTLWLAGSRVLRLEALYLALMGMNRELHEGFTRQESELRTSMARMHSLETQRHAEQADQEERRHDVRSALFAIGGVADLLGRGHEDLDRGTLDALTQALGAEVQRLQGLVAEQEREACEPFSLLEAVSPLVLMERSNGLDVTCNVSERLVAVGRRRETVQVLRNLLDNARLYAGGSPVTVRGEERDDWVVLIVEDRGPGVPVSERKAIFERGRRGSSVGDIGGSGLGLYVAARLMREQGGDLWVTERADGGASFVLSLPAVAAASPPRSRRHSSH